MFINSNQGVLQAYNNYEKFNRLTQKSMEKLSSGQRINHASDDPLGLAISEKMRSQIRGMNQAQRIVQDGRSMLELADKTLEVSQEILQRLHELAVQGSSETLTDSDREQMGKEVTELIEQLDKTSKNTEFNGKKLFDGDGTFRIATGSNGESTTIAFGYFGTDGIGGSDRNGNGFIALDEFKPTGEHPISPKESMQNLMSVTKDVLEQVSSERASIGAKANRLEFTERTLVNQSEIMTSAESRIRDVDTAKEMMVLAKNQIFAQASMAMMAQGMQNNESVLMLLRG